MADDEKSSKVVRLFPSGSSPSDSSADQNNESLAAIGSEIQGLLGAAVPIEAGEAKPDPRHRNAVPCPQCDEYTWKQTRYCLHCGTDLLARAAELAAARRDRRNAALWPCAIASWAAALGCIQATERYALPDRVRSMLHWTVLAIVAVNLFGFWIASMSNRR